MIKKYTIFLALFVLIFFSNTFAYKFYFKRGFTVDYIVYVCEDYIVSCSSWNAIYTLWIKENLFSTTIYLCKGSKLSCDYLNADYEYEYDNY